MRGRSFYTHRFACFRCRKTFAVKYTADQDGPQFWEQVRDNILDKHCPACGGPLRFMGDMFKAPKSSDVKQWRKVEILHNQGIIFHGYVQEKLPDELRQIPEFLENSFYVRQKKSEGEKLLEGIECRRGKKK